MENEATYNLVDSAGNYVSGPWFKEQAERLAKRDSTTECTCGHYHPPRGNDSTSRCPALGCTCPKYEPGSLKLLKAL